MFVCVLVCVCWGIGFMNVKKEASPLFIFGKARLTGASTLLCQHGSVCVCVFVTACITDLVLYSSLYYDRDYE